MMRSSRDVSFASLFWLQQSIGAVSPRLAALAAAVLFSRRLAGILCRKLSTEAQLFSGSPVNIYLAEESSSECCIYESCCGLAPFFKRCTLSAAYHIHVHWLYQPISV